MEGAQLPMTSRMYCSRSSFTFDLMAFSRKPSTGPGMRSTPAISSRESLASSTSWLWSVPEVMGWKSPVVTTTLPAFSGDWYRSRMTPWTYSMSSFLA